MFKKFFRKVRDTAKKIAPIAAPIAGFAFGAPVGAGIGALLGQYGGTKGALQGAMLGGLGGLAGNYAQTGQLFGTQGVQGGVGFKEGLRNIISGRLPAGVDPNVAAADMYRSTRTGGIMDALSAAGKFATSGKGMLTAAAIAAMMNNKEEDDSEREEIEIGSQGQLGDMKVADIEYLPANVPVFPSGYAGYAGYANGGIVALAEGGTPPPKNMDDYPRKNGNIAGPGTMTSDDIPAMLSDGEFVTKAVSVIGAGVREGADNIEDAREMGSDFFYKQQDELAKLGERLVNGN
jgi:hypothetical protein